MTNTTASTLLTLEERLALETVLRRRKEAAHTALRASALLLVDSLETDETIVFADAVHREHRSRPAHGWFPVDEKVAVKATTFEPVDCCGAVVREVVGLIGGNSWDQMKVECLPASLHSDPDKLPERVGFGIWVRPLPS